MRFRSRLLRSLTSGSMGHADGGDVAAWARLVVRAVSAACESGGNTYCSQLANSSGCSDVNGFNCRCHDGYRPAGFNYDSQCVDIDECAEGLDNCRNRNAKCVNTSGSFECGCGPYSKSEDGKCVDVNQCETNRGGCDEHSDCRVNPGNLNTCICHPGWTGNDSKPGVACKDINECHENPAICPLNAICSNLPGSYKCECGPGFVGDSSGSGCVTEDFCGTGKNDCDPNFAVCSLVPGSFKCECIRGFRGAGAVNTCEPLAGNEKAACAALGLDCGLYKECEKSRTRVGSWECTNKDAGEQFMVFLRNGATDDTPTWVWAVLAVSIFLLLLITGGIIWCVYKRFRAKSEDAENELLYDADPGEGYSYGATQGAYA